MFKVNYSWHACMQNIQNLCAPICYFSYMYSKPSLLIKCLFSLWNISAMFSKILCNWMLWFIFSTQGLPKYHKKYFNNLRKATVKFVTCSWIFSFRTPEFWSEKKIPLRKLKKKNPNNKQVLDLSCMLEGKRKGRWKRPSF